MTDAASFTVPSFRRHRISRLLSALVGALALALGVAVCADATTTPAKHPDAAYDLSAADTSAPPTRGAATAWVRLTITNRFKLGLDTLPARFGVAAKAGAAVPRVAGGAHDLFEIAPRVAGQLGDARLGRLAGRLTPDDLQRLANNPSAARYFDARTGNINVIQNVQGVTLRITTPRDAMRIISVGPIRARQVANRVSAGDFLPLP
jgi:hypothetical protein